MTIESSKNEGARSAQRPDSPLRRRLLKLTAAIFGAAALNQVLPPQETGAGGPPQSPGIPTPDREAVLNDLIPRSELRSKYNIEILDLPNAPKYVKLNFLNSAQEHQVFQKLVELNVKDNSKLYVVLLDGPYVDPKFLTPEQLATLPEEAPTKLKEACEQYVMEGKKQYERTKKGNLLKYSDGLILFKRELSSGRITEDQYLNEIQNLEQLYLEPTREMILERARAANLTPNTDGIENRYIFMPVRNVPDRVVQTGNEKSIYPSSPDKHGYPQPYQSYPDPIRFDINPDNKMYPLQSGSTPSVDLRHELEHVIGAKHPYADLMVIDDITTAFQEAQKGDKKGFWIVWETEEGLTVSQKQSTTAA